MTREDIKKHFPEATDDQISALLDINSKDIGKHKKIADDANAELKTAKETISKLEKNQTDAAALQKTIDDYKAADEKRRAEERAAAEHAAILSRFDKAHEEIGKGREWVHDYVKQGVLADFEKALADEANNGKGDVQILSSLINDEKGVKPGLYKSQVSGGMAGMGGIPSGKKYSISELMRMKNENPALDIKQFMNNGGNN